MKISFKAQKLVPFGKEEALSKTKLFLEKNNYNIVAETTSSIGIDGTKDDFKFISNLSYYTRIDEGEFEFLEAEQVTEVKLTYRESVSFEVIALVLITFAVIYIDFKATVLLVVIILNFLIKILNIRKNFIDGAINSKDR